MTRQRLRESSIRWETQLSLDSFSQKIIKKIQHLAFTDKVKIIKSYVPEKVKIFIENNLQDELKYFQKKYVFKIEILSDEKLIIPEYKIELLNKTKKIIDKIENINAITQAKVVPIEKLRKNKKPIKKDTSKLKSKKVLRTLWVRKKKKFKSSQKLVS